MALEPYKDKLCKDCGLIKPVSDFNYAARGKWLNSYCKPCTALRSRNYYHKNKGQGKLHFERRRAEQQKLMFEYFYNNPCVDCGNTDIRTLQFDHVSDNKEHDIGIMMRGHMNWDKILNEMQKCEVVCANCHCIRTSIRANNWRQRCLNKEVDYGTRAI